MADFPALEPKSRSYDMGSYPISERPTFAGGSMRFRHGTVARGHGLQMVFFHLSAAEGKLIRDHYQGQQGGYLAFALSADAWRGHDSMTDLVPSTTRWRYAEPPEETHKDGGYMDVTVSLVSVI